MSRIIYVKVLDKSTLQDHQGGEQAPHEVYRSFNRDRKANKTYLGNKQSKYQLSVDGGCTKMRSYTRTKI